MRMLETISSSVLGILLLGCASGREQRTAAFLPESNEAPGWARTGEIRTFMAGNLWEYINGDAERYLQAGVERTLTADYRYQDKVEAVVDVYVMKTAEGAQAIFAAESAVGSGPAPVGDAARLFPTSLLFRKRQFLVRITAFEEGPDLKPALLELGRAVEKKL